MRDFAFEALAEVTSTDWKEGRGELNAALKSLKEQEPDLALDSYLLSVEIHERAKMYRAVMGDEILLTPSALAKHWMRVKEQAPKPTYAYLMGDIGTDATPFFCSSCDNHKMVMTSEDPEEWAPCPDCNTQANASFWRWDGTRYSPPPPAEVRARMIRR